MKIYDIDYELFNRLKKKESSSEGLVDTNKYFKNVKKGESIFFASNNEMIEAKLEDIKIYNSVPELINKERLPSFSLISDNPLEILSIIEKSNTKKIRVYKVKYMPYKNDLEIVGEKIDLDFDFDDY